MRISLFHENDSGFTMIETIAVLMLIGIIAAVAISKSMSANSYSLVSEAEILKTYLRFAQLKAMSDVVPTWGIAVGGSSYTLQKNGATASINLPGEGSATHAFPSGVSATEAQTVAFNNWGNPGTTTISITLTGGSDNATVTVTKNTGFVQ